VGLSNVVAIAGGFFHSLALKSNGTVVAWGAGATNSGGLPDLGQAIIPVGLSNVVAIAAGELYSLALKSDGTVAAWGNNGFGQTNIPAGLSNVVAIAGGYSHSLALKLDGTVVAWGAGTDNTGNPHLGQSIVPLGLSNVVAIAAGGLHSLALKRDGTVAAWGENGQGQTTLPVGLSNVVAIAGGRGHSLALRQQNVPATLALLNGNNVFQGAITATGFTGNGGGLTNLNPANIAGTLSPIQIPNLDASKISSGTVADARLSANVALRAGGNSFTGNQSMSGSLDFGAQTRQMLNLWNAEYGIGVQGDALYFRTGNDYHWYRSGSHSDVNGNAGGGGGVPLMSLNRSGFLGLGITTPGFPLDVQSGLAVGRFTTTNNANGAVLALRNNTASPTYLGAINFEDSGTPGQIAYLASGQMTFRVGGADKMNLRAGGLYVDNAIVLTSDRNAKQDFAAVDAQEVLEKVAALPLQSWSYTNRPGVKHVGPMAQDFRAAFGLGEDDKHIATVDADGVALAAIQGLNQKLTDELRQKGTEITELKQRLDALEKIIINQKSN